MQIFPSFIRQYRHQIFLVLYLIFGIYAWQEASEIFALASTLWMNIFNFDPFTTWEGVWEYFIELRTGVPPAISFLEVICYRLTGSYQPITHGFYRFSLIAMLLLPVLFTRRRFIDYVVHLILAFIFLKALIKIVMGNPQMYDVLTPVFLMLFVLFVRAGLGSDHHRGRQLWLMAGAGFFLSMAELARPFMIALVPILIGIVIYRFRNRRKALIPFLTLFLLLSGGWHTKLLIQHGQLIWSNHSGANLVGAWAPLLDHKALEATLEPEEPPLVVNQWTWDNINTDVHARNTAKQKAAVFAAIADQPGKAFDHFLTKVGTFTEPQVGMYSYHPEGWDIEAYKWLVHVGFWLLGFMMIRSLILVIGEPARIASESVILTGMAAFLTLMPVIGESGEEARFLVTVIPFLVWLLIYVPGLLFPGKSVSSDTNL